MVTTMHELAEVLVRGAVVGLGGALAMDLWGLVLRRGFGIPTLDYALLGRWIGGMPAGRLTVTRIAAAPPVVGERPLGTAAHYAIGVAFAWLLLAITGPGWLDAPTLLPALAIGLATIVAPWFVMQPAMGAGFLALKTPTPLRNSLRNLANHSVFGVGLYLAAAALAQGGA